MGFVAMNDSDRNPYASPETLSSISEQQLSNALRQKQLHRGFMVTVVCAVGVVATPCFGLLCILMRPVILFFLLRTAGMATVFLWLILGVGIPTVALGLARHPEYFRYLLAVIAIVVAAVCGGMLLMLDTTLLGCFVFGFGTVYLTIVSVLLATSESMESYMAERRERRINRERDKGINTLRNLMR